MNSDISSPRYETSEVKYGQSGKKHYGKFHIILEDRPNTIETTVWGNSRKEVEEKIKKYLQYE